MDSAEKMHRLVRSLNLIPYLRKHPEASVFEIARDLNLEPNEVMRDIQRLHLSGVGSGPGEMIDLVADWTGITLIDDQGLDKPLRLTPTEAGALLLTLESLETMPGLVDQDAVTSAADKLRRVIDARGLDDATASTDDSVSGVVAQALAKRRQLSMTYYSASSDRTSELTVSPEKLFHRDGSTYIRAWDGTATKTFRLDRMSSAQLLDEPSAAPQSHFDERDPFGFSAEQTATLLVAPEATWLADYWEIDLLHPREDGWWEATMEFGHPDWMVRFCLSQADRLRVLSPPFVVEEIAQRAESAMRGYDLSNDGG